VDSYASENGQVGFQAVVEQQAACAHRVIIGKVEFGKGRYIEQAITFEQGDCVFCLRRWATYWKGRAQTAEGQLAALRAQKPEAPTP
jgi:hypothetical protein